jgi:hypothetical protein
VPIVELLEQSPSASSRTATSGYSSVRSSNGSASSSGEDRLQSRTPRSRVTRCVNDYEEALVGGILTNLASFTFYAFSRFPVSVQARVDHERVGACYFSAPLPPGYLLNHGGDDSTRISGVDETDRKRSMH